MDELKFSILFDSLQPINDLYEKLVQLLPLDGIQNSDFSNIIDEAVLAKISFIQENIQTIANCINPSESLTLPSSGSCSEPLEKGLYVALWDYFPPLENTQLLEMKSGDVLDYKGLETCQGWCAQA